MHEYAKMPLRELSLFTGAGLGIWATTHLLGWRTIGYVEWDRYCQRVLRARIDDGSFHDAPIFGDIRAFVSDGYAASYQGMVDVITAGFPCQPFSSAGHRLGADDPRNMWPSTIECIRQIRPRFALLENVPALINSGYFERILGDLAEVGMAAIWGVFSACATGAPHTRERLFILVYADDCRMQRWIQSQRGTKGSQQGAAGFRIHNTASSPIRLSSSVWGTGDSDLLRVADGNTDRGHRIKAAANGQVPIVVATAWHMLSREIVRRQS